MQDFPAEHCIGSRWKVLLSLTVSGFDVKADQCMHKSSECGLSEVNRKTLVYPHHAFQDLQVHTSLCLYVDFIGWCHLYILSYSALCDPTPHLQPVCWFIKGSVRLVGQPVLDHLQCSVLQPGDVASLGKPLQQGVWWLWRSQSWVGVGEPAASHLSEVCR